MAFSLLDRLPTWRIVAVVGGTGSVRGSCYCWPRLCCQSLFGSWPCLRGPNPTSRTKYFVWQEPSALLSLRLYDRLTYGLFVKDCGPVAAVLIMFGAIAAISGKDRSRPLWGWSATGFVFWLVFAPKMREHDYYELVFLPVLAAWGALGLRVILRLANARPRARVWVASFTLSAAAIIHSPLVASAKYDLELGHLVVAQRLKEVCPDGSRVIVMGQGFGWPQIHYSGRQGWVEQWETLPANWPATIANYRGLGAEYVVVYFDPTVPPAARASYTPLLKSATIIEHRAGPWFPHGRPCEYYLLSLRDAPPAPAASVAGRHANCGRLPEDRSRMMRATESLATATRWARRRVQWRSTLRMPNKKRVPAWRRLLRGLFMACTLLGSGVATYFWITEPPRIEPPFERIVRETAGPITSFTLKDPQGAFHSRSEWAGRTAVVIFLLGTNCSTTDEYAAEMARLGRVYSRRDIAFYGVYSDPGVSAELAQAHAARHDLPFPILLDPGLTVARQAGAKVTPEVLVLADDGQVFYHGRIDDRFRSDGKRRSQASVHDLENVLRALLAEELPAVSHVQPFGSPLPSALEEGRAR